MTKVEVWRRQEGRRRFHICSSDSSAEILSTYLSFHVETGRVWLGDGGLSLSSASRCGTEGDGAEEDDGCLFITSQTTRAGKKIKIKRQKPAEHSLTFLGETQTGRCRRGRASFRFRRRWSVRGSGSGPEGEACFPSSAPTSLLLRAMVF